LAQHPPPVFLAHLVAMLACDNVTSSANGTFDRHDRQDSARRGEVMVVTTNRF